MAEMRRRYAFPAAGLVRSARRKASCSQRELAKRAGVSRAAIGKIEAGTMMPSLGLMLWVLRTAGFWLVAVDAGGRLVLPMEDWENTRDGAERRYPSHLDTILDPDPGEWWGDLYGLARPPETFHRDRELRDAIRARSQYEVRASKYRFGPPPLDPEYWWRLRQGWD
ncbi:helix-turn-helix transcriptional regulator [Actinoplanes sp. NPDC049265]|uniref:helix-turn-helix transcriptional regulator n=1 Tax=Actinoplanes sp. NPDC049265 TaxID=3363902 RepID=UPI00372262E9